MEKQQSQSTSQDGSAANRCPYCHESIDIESDAWVACQECLARHHSDCWAELASCASCRAQGRLETADATPMRELELTAEEADSGASRSRMKLLFLIAAVFASSMLYRLLVAQHLEQTAALFIGIPALLAALLAFTPKAKTTTGIIMKGMTLAMLVSGVALGEGFVCILMSAPIFYAIGLSVGLFVDYRRRRDASQGKAMTVAFVLLSFMSLEGTHQSLSFERDETVVVTKTLALSLEDFERGLAATPQFEEPMPLFLRLGFPLPVRVAGAGLKTGDTRLVHLSGGEGEGDLILEVRANSSYETDGRVGRRVVFEPQMDSSPISHWLAWKTITVDWSRERIASQESPQIQVSWTIEYRRDLDPAWYFKPMQRYGVGLAAEVMIDNVAAQAR